MKLGPWGAPTAAHTMQDCPAPWGCREFWWDTLRQNGSGMASSSPPGQRGSGGRVIVVEAEAVPSPAAARSAEPAGVPGAIHGG